jgi:hypothetical protein
MVILFGQIYERITKRQYTSQKPSQKKLPRPFTGEGVEKIVLLGLSFIFQDIPDTPDRLRNPTKQDSSRYRCPWRAYSLPMH